MKIRFKKKFWRRWAKRAVNLLQALITMNIVDEIARKMWLSTFEVSENIIEALGDADPNNKKQIAEIVKRHFNESTLPIAKEMYEAWIR